MVITLARALKYRKRIIERIAKVTGRIQAENSNLLGNPPTVDIRTAMTTRSQLVDHLIDVRLKISKENKGIEREILLISEIKAQITMLKSVTVRDGKEAGSYGQPETTWVAQLKQTEIDRTIENLEKELDLTQDAIDKFNYTHQIELPDTDLGIW